jgi:protoporphyrinogen oxidase
LQLRKSLSSTYWLNVNDASFPFVGIIEHTNFENKNEYGSHIVYLSKYIETSDQLFKMSKSDFLKFSIKYIKKVFPEFSEDWVIKYDMWKANYSQPIVGKNYSKLIPLSATPYNNLYLATMAQIYPEDRGTNYAIREGIKVASLIIANT